MKINLTYCADNQAIIEALVATARAGLASEAVLLAAFDTREVARLALSRDRAGHMRWQRVSGIRATAFKAIAKIANKRLAELEAGAAKAPRITDADVRAMLLP